MSKTVAHFIRKSSQLRASFINNQISNHIEYKPTIIYRYQSQKDDGGFAEFNRNDISILNLSDSKKFDLNLRYLKKLSKKDLDKVLTFLKENNASVLHFHYGSDACIYSDVIKYSGIPSVVSFYGYDAFSFKNLMYGYGQKLLDRIFENATTILAMTEEMKVDLIKSNCPVSKIITHYHGVPAKRFLHTDFCTLFKNKAFTFLIVAYLDPVKGHLFVLDALKRIINDGIKNIEFRIIGTGFYETKLKKYVEQNKLNAYVKFIGQLEYLSDEMLNEFEHADAFIHPSITTKNDKEGIPGAIVEAMMAGLPVISTYHGGIPYIIKNMETGLLVNEWDVNALTEKIKLLLDDSTLRIKLGRSGQKYAFDNLNITEKEKELESIYDTLLKNN